MKYYKMKKKKKNDSYDGITSAGTFTHGHVGPEPAFAEMARILKPSGIAVIGVNISFFSDNSFDDVLAKLSSTCKVLSCEEHDYVQASNLKCKLLVLQKKL